MTITTFICEDQEDFVVVDESVTNARWSTIINIHEWQFRFSCSLNQHSANVTWGKLILREGSANKIQISTYIHLNSRTSTQNFSLFWASLRNARKKEETKKTKITLRLSNKYDFKHLNYAEDRSEYVTEETMKALENGSASDEAGDFVTKKSEPDMQDFQQQVEIGQMKTSESAGELEELNKNVRKY